MRSFSWAENRDRTVYNLVGFPGPGMKGRAGADVSALIPGFRTRSSRDGSVHCNTYLDSPVPSLTPSLPRVGRTSCSRVRSPGRRVCQSRGLGFFVWTHDRGKDCPRRSTAEAAEDNDAGALPDPRAGRRSNTGAGSRATCPQHSLGTLSAAWASRPEIMIGGRLMAELKFFEGSWRWSTKSVLG